MTSVARRRELDESGDYSDVSHENDHNTSGNDAQPDSDYGDARGSESDSSERDGEEVPEGERQVDDDEDRSNPQYIPKRGTFYEHDDRTAASGGEESTLNSTTDRDSVSDKKETSTQPPTERRRPPRGSEIIDKWSHDKFNEKDQTPKSREELVAIYGYDIRNEDAPPHARRNRRYGRGPNKYTRTWEDVEAYKRQALNTPQPNRKPPNLEDFPELDTSGRRIRKKAPFHRDRPRSKSQPPSNESSERSSSLKRNASTKTQRNATQIAMSKAPFRNAVRANNGVNNNANVGVKVGAQGGKVAFKDKLPNIENLTITASVNNSGAGPQRRVNAAAASQQRPAQLLQPKKPAVTSAPVTQDIRGTQNAPVPNKSPPRQQALPHKQLNNVPTPSTLNKQELTSTQAAIQAAEARGSKRYSSLRQRALGDNYTPLQPMSLPSQATHHQHALINEYQAANAQQHSTPPQQVQQQQQLQSLQNNSAQQMLPQQQQLLHQQVHMSQAVSQSQHGRSPPHQSISQQQHNQQVRLGMMEQQQMVSHAHHPIHNLPQQHTMVSSQMSQSQGYAPPAMMPAQFMQVQASNNSGVFAAPMYAQPPPAPYTHQLYQHHNYAPPGGVAGAAGVPGGLTYYSAVEQEPAAPAPRPHRRPTAAIPILKPNHADRPPNPADTEKIDRLVDNMFVRKPWPVTPGGVDPKEKSDKTNQDISISKETSQSPSMTSSSISTDSRPSTERTDQKIDQDNIEQQGKQIAEPVQAQVVEESTKVAEVSQSCEEGSIANA